jgi:glycosyltransferase involved in cell wall biosynthesis
MAWWMPLKARSKLELLVTSVSKDTLTFIERYASNVFRQKLRRLIGEFKPDVIHFDLIAMTQYLSVVPEGIGTVASINDSLTLTLENRLAAQEYGLLERVYRRYELMRVRHYEQTVYPSFGVTHVVSERDKQCLLELNPLIRTSVISNGVDPTLFDITGLTYGKTDLLFLGQLTGVNLYYLEQFMEKSWPLIRSELPNVRLNVVGKGGPENKKLLARAESLGGIVLRGYVQKLSDAYSGCGIAVIPIDKTCGILNKAIESMAAGLVTIGFESSFCGIPQAKNGIHHFAGRDYKQMARIIIEMSRDPEKRCSIQREAHRMAREHYSWDDRLRVMEKMYSFAGIPNDRCPDLLCPTI